MGAARLVVGFGFATALSALKVWQLSHKENWTKR
jgi:hypothetical protein